MMRGLWSAASGMTAQQTNLDVIANNLANVNTTGYKRSRADFQDLLYQTMRDPGSATGGTSTVPSGIQIGMGTRTAAVQKVFTTGDLKQTGNQWDIAIEGDGFLNVQLPDGTIAYTRDGSLAIDNGGRLVTADGYLVQPLITVDSTMKSIAIGPDGTVSATMNDGTIQTLGQLTMSRFINPGGLNSIGHNLYLPSAASGAATTGIAGSTGYGRIAQGTLEMSNVATVEEMVAMIVAQRAYETNSKAIQAADEMLQMANGLRR